MPDVPTLTVNTVAPLPPVPAPAAVDPNQVVEYAATSWYLWDRGLAQMAAAGPPGTPCRFVRLHAPTCRKVVVWLTQRLGARPRAPHWDTGSANEVLLFKAVGLPAPGRMIDGTQVWQLTGTYIYGLQVPPADDDPLCAGSGPYDPSTASANLVLASDFLRSLVGPVPAVTGGGQPALTL